MAPIGGSDIAIGRVENVGTVTCNAFVNLVTGTDVLLTYSPPGTVLLAPGEHFEFEITVSPNPGAAMVGNRPYEFVNDGEAACVGQATMCTLPVEEESVHYGWEAGIPKFDFRAQVDGDGATFIPREVDELIDTGVDTCWYEGSFYRELPTPADPHRGSMWRVGPGNKWGPLGFYPYNVDMVGTSSELIAWYRADRAHYSDEQNQALCLPPHDLPGCVPTKVEASGASCGFFYFQEMKMECTNIPHGETFWAYTSHGIGFAFDATYLQVFRDQMTRTRVWP